MFEKEAEDKAFEKYPLSDRCDRIDLERNLKYEEGFQDGAEFGYNKANEWHYVKDELPKEMHEVIICIKDEKRITRAKRIKNDLWTSPREDFNTQEIIAWKGLPKLPKESK